VDPSGLSDTDTGKSRTFPETLKYLSHIYFFIQTIPYERRKWKRSTRVTGMRELKLVQLWLLGFAM
jgi:hypothetical protein